MTDEEDVTCLECGDAVEGMGTVYVVYGDWDRERRGFDRGDHSFHYCPECWSTEYDTTKATAYQTDDPDELWAILEASGGNLVADFSTFFVPGPCYARVADGELETITVNSNPHRTDEGKIAFDPEVVETDPHDLFLDEMLEPNTDPERPIYLKPADDTPFKKIRDVDQRSYAPTEEA